MPFHLKAPRAGKTPFWYINGHHGCVDIDEIWGSGRTTRLTDEDAAKDLRARLEAAAEVSRFQFFKEFGLKDPDAEPAPEAITLKQALEAQYPAPRANYVQLIIDNFGKLDARTVAANGKKYLGEMKAKLYPQGTPGTLNRQLYTPIIAALREQEIACAIKRPRGHVSPKHDEHITEEQLPIVLAECDKVSHQYGLFCALLATSPTRENEIKQFRVGWYNRGRKTITVPGWCRKNRKPLTFDVHGDLVSRLEAHIAGKADSDFAFDYSKREGGVWTNILWGCLQRAGRGDLPFRHRGYHIFRHTFATLAVMMGLDLVRDTGGWDSEQEAARYNHWRNPATGRKISSIKLRAAPDLQAVA